MHVSSSSYDMEERERETCVYLARVKGKSKVNACRPLMRSRSTILILPKEFNTHLVSDGCVCDVTGVMPDASRSTGPLIGEADDTITRDSRVPSHLQGAAEISGAYWTSGKMHSQTFAGCL